MANPTPLLLILLLAVAAVHTTAKKTKLECREEIQVMSGWQCTMWMSGERGRAAAARLLVTPEERLKQCCDQLNSLSSECRCHAVWEMRKVSQLYGHVACRLPQECGFACTGCPAASAAVSETFAI